MIGEPPSPAWLGASLGTSSGNRGAVITSMRSDGPAKSGGLQVGNIITAIDGKRVRCKRDNSSVVLVVLSVCSAGHSAPTLTADDFTSPIQAPEEQREKLLAVQSPDAVKTEDDPELEVQVTSALTAQDAINAIVQRHEEGCNMVAMPGGGYGFVATGMGTYRKDMKNITALRIAQRNAYVQALMQAKVQMAGQVSGLAMNGRTNFDQFVSAEDDDTQSTSRSSSSSS
ncbi:MAG: PDZ domain-containing protein [Synergistaceae bacterium]|nr:PDZ domain-containing protein [Synergistaceae bacterium]